MQVLNFAYLDSSIIEQVVVGVRHCARLERSKGNQSGVFLKDGISSSWIVLCFPESGGRSGDR